MNRHHGVAILLLSVSGVYSCPALQAGMFRVSKLSPADIARANTARPQPGSHVRGTTPAEAFAQMNRVLLQGPARTRACDEFDHEELNDVARKVHDLRQPQLDSQFRSIQDRRALHFDSISYKEKLWKAERAATSALSSHARGTPKYNATRDGKCAEAVMWWTHHLSEDDRVLLGGCDNFTLPLLPKDVAPPAHRGHEYDQQIGCTSCHVAVHIPGAPPISPIPEKNGTGPQYPETCPIDPSTKKPTVWYNRTKRCDWDYVPFCSPCEGVGGFIWGPNEEDWLPMPCEAIASPSDIPAANRTSPLWPKSFTVDEKASLTFPGRDPCKIDFKNSTYQLLFETTPEGPIYHTIGKTGPSGPSPFPGKSWALPNGNFYTTVDAFGKSTFCTCLGPVDPVVDNAITGPLRYDFNNGAKLIGRERVKPEYYDDFVICDHWAKGPHHFWIDVATNLMIREWQPFNGLQTYLNWNVSEPDPAKIAVEEICYKGLLHVNISCKAPPPADK